MRRVKMKKLMMRIGRSRSRLETGGEAGGARTDGEGGAAMTGGGEQQHGKEYMEQGVQRIRNTKQGIHLLVHLISPMFLCDTTTLSMGPFLTYVALDPYVV